MDPEIKQPEMKCSATLYLLWNECVCVRDNRRRLRDEERLKDDTVRLHTPRAGMRQTVMALCSLPVLSAPGPAALSNSNWTTDTGINSLAAELAAEE